VPFLAIGADLRGRTFREGGRLADVAPTILEYLKLPQPPEMDAVSLFERSPG
jgi:2,3-bisphosphoglycerate-independent phosphoglycerate mutase